MINRKVIYIFLFLILIGFTSCGGTNNNLTTNELPTSSEETTALTTAEFETTRDNPSTQEITTEIPTDIEETTTSISTTIDQTTTVPTTTKNQTTETTTIHYVIITFDNMEGASGTTSMEGIAGNSFSMPDNPTRSGFVFDGWFLEDTFETPFNISEYPQNNMTVYAKWTKLISIYFETLNGSSNTPILIGVIGDLFQLPDNPIRFGYVFDGWYLNQTFTTPFTMTVFPDNDITVYAKWVEEVTVINEMVDVLETEFGFTCSNNVCELQESSWITYKFNLNNVTFTKELLDDDPSGDEQIKSEIVVIDENWDVEYNISITYLSTQTATMRVTGNGETGTYTVRSFSSNYLSENNMYDDAVQFIDGPYSGVVAFLEYILEFAELTLDDLDK